MQIFTNVTDSINSTKTIVYGLWAVMLLVTGQVMAQPTVLGTQTVNGTYVTYDLSDLGAFRQVRFQASSAAGASSRNWEFATGTALAPVYSINWRPYTIGQTLAAYNTFIDPATAAASARYNTGFGGQSGLMPAVTSGNYYTFNVTENAGSNNNMAVLETSYNPVGITAVTQNPASVAPNNVVSVMVTTSAAPSAGENVFVRYTTDGYVTSSLIPVVFTGTSGQAIIPCLSAGTTVSYYVYSSNKSSASILSEVATFGQAAHDMSVLSLNNNAGANYSYTVGATTTNFAGAYSVPGSCYATLASFITALNAGTVTGPVICYVAAGYTETAPVGGFSITKSGTAANTITFIRSGAGANPVFTAPASPTIGSRTDAVFKIIGSDYVKISGFTIQENSLNTVGGAIGVQQMTEFGIGIFANSTTDGAQNNTIENCTITMSSATAYQNAIGIFSTSASSSTNGSQAAGSIGGTNSFNKFYGNTISGVAFGVYFISPAQTATVFESGNEVGGATLATGNTITFGISNTASDLGFTSFSGTTPSGVFFRNVVGNSVRFNTITSVSTLTLTCGGIFSANGTNPTGVTYTSNFSDNTIVITNVGTTVINAIDFGSGLSTGTLVANNNVITINQTTNLSNSAAVTGIKANYPAATNTANGNTLTFNQTTSGTGTTSSALVGLNLAGTATTINALSNTITFNQTTSSTSAVTSSLTGISATAVATTVNIGSLGNGNTITIKQAVTGSGSYGSGSITYIDVTAGHATANVVSNTLNTTGSTIRSTGTLVCVKPDATVTVLYNIKSNTANIDRIATSGTISFTSQSTTPSNVADTVSLNTITFTGLAGTTVANGISQLGGPSASSSKNINNNTINISGTHTGTTKGIAWGYSSGAKISGNNVTISCAAPTVIGLDGTSTSAGGNGGVNNNVVSLTSSSTSPTSVIGISGGGTGPFQVANNTIGAINLTGVITGSPVVTGIAIAVGTGNNINNNNISNITVGAAGSTASPIVDGILISGGTSVNIYKNKIHNISTAAAGTSTVVNGVRISAEYLDRIKC